MNPGVSCLHCHPTFTLGGTVYPTLHEPYNCNGTDGSTGVKVVISEADGKKLTLIPGKSGNFYTTEVLSTPITVVLINGSTERVMMAQQTTGDCNSCHTPYGALKAPGRIMAP